jgi:hypothetical protein
MDDDKLKQIANSSGFPLQIGLENLVNGTSIDHGWKVLYKEHPWESSYSNNSGFIDLVLTYRDNISIMIIECKRVQDSNWIFMLPSDNQARRRQAKVWISRFNTGGKNYFDWYDITASPPSPESEFCVVHGQDNKSKPMLERIAAGLVDATESLAREEYEFYKPENIYTRLYFNVIVTTADLKLCSFDAGKVSLDTGMIEEAEFRSVPFVRFRKCLSTKPVDQLHLAERSPYHLTRAKENTVFIVNASHFSEFLKEIELENTLFRNFGV